MICELYESSIIPLLPAVEGKLVFVIQGPDCLWQRLEQISYKLDPEGVWH